MMDIPQHLILPIEVFAPDFVRLHQLGEQTLADADVTFVGLARNCAGQLEQNLQRLMLLASSCRQWRLHIETNDNDDNTDQVLIDFCRNHREATFTSQRLGREQLSNEFAGRRTQALSEYRTACQRWVRDNARHTDFVVVIDWDMCGGWSHAGFLAGLGSLQHEPNAYGMASVSMFKHVRQDADTLWLHYDAWALRLNSTWDDYTAGQGEWKHHWLPPVGSPAIPVRSAFGGLAVYDTDGYLAGVYDGADCEHVAFHESAARKTGRKLYLCPSMQTVIALSAEADDGGRDGHD